MSQTKQPGQRKPRILIVTPEITYLPAGMGNMADKLSAKAGGLADVSASLVASLFKLGADGPVALPHYRRMFHADVGRLIRDELPKDPAHPPPPPPVRISAASHRSYGPPWSGPPPRSPCSARRAESRAAPTAGSSPPETY